MYDFYRIDWVYVSGIYAFLPPPFSSFLQICVAPFNLLLVEGDPLDWVSDLLQEEDELFRRLRSDAYAAVSGYLFCDFPCSHLGKFGVALLLAGILDDLIPFSALVQLRFVLAQLREGCQCFTIW